MARGGNRENNLATTREKWQVKIRSRSCRGKTWRSQSCITVMQREKSNKNRALLHNNNLGDKINRPKTCWRPIFCGRSHGVCQTPWHFSLFSLLVFIRRFKSVPYETRSTAKRISTPVRQSYASKQWSGLGICYGNDTVTAVRVLSPAEHFTLEKYSSTGVRAAGTTAVRGIRTLAVGLRAERAWCLMFARTIQFG